MKIKNGFVAREIAGQYVVVALGQASKVFNGIIKLNESAKFIWDMLARGAEKEEIVEALLNEYEGVDAAVVEADVEKFINELEGANILE
ncbi:MAG: PqqD family protein [Ruminococcaceae bacterium]|nr:PqqD family protein [Oscillospiraceae bacterium]